MWNWTTIGSDAAWVRRALGDRPRAFEVLVLRYERRAHAIARAVGVPAACVEDVVQEAFLKAFENLPQLRQPESFGLWFLSIVRNTGRRWHREARRETAPLPEDIEAAPGESVEQAELRETLWRKVSEMPEGIREAVFLYYHEGESARRTAAALGISLAAALKRLERGRELLREKLWGEMEERLRGSMPSSREWTRRARRLVILLIGTVGASWGAAAAGAGLAATSTGAATASANAALGKAALSPATLGGITMAGKKTAAIVLTAIALGAGLGGLLFLRSPDSEGGASKPRGTVRRVAVERIETNRRAPSARPESAGRGPEAGLAEPRPGDSTEPPLSIAGRVLRSDARSGIGGALIRALPVRSWTKYLDGSEPFTSLADPLAVLKARLRDSQGDPCFHAASKPDGSYRFVGLEDGEYRLLVSHDEFQPSAETWALVERGKPARCDILLDGAEAIAGLVVDENGGPIAGASIIARPSEERRLGPRARTSKLVDSIRSGSFLVERRMTASDADGSFRLASLPPVPHDLSVRKSGLMEALVADVPPGARDLKIVLSEGLAIRGRLLLPNREPVAAFKLELEERSGGKVPPPAVGESMDQEFMGDADLDLDAGPSAVSADDGGFEFRGLRPGEYGLTAGKGGTVVLRMEVRLEEAPVDLGDLFLSVSQSIRGRVVDPAGLPVAGARVWIDEARSGGISWWGGQLYAPEVLDETRSGPQGEFTLRRLNEGVYTVRAVSRADAPAARTGVAAGSEGVVVALARGRAIDGSVVDGRDGSPIAGAEVILLTGLSSLTVPEKRAETGETGTFEIRGVPFDGNQKKLRVSHPAFGRAKEVRLADGPGAGPVRIELFPLDRISGRVVDAAGNGVAGARVVLDGSAISTADGSFTLEVSRSLRDWEGGARVFARLSSLGCGWSPSIQAPGPLEPWPEAEIVLGPSSELRGRILDAAGAPVANARVREVASRQGDRLRPEAFAGYSDRSGAYRIAGIEPGTFEVEVLALGFAPLHVSGIEVGSEPRELDFTLDAGVSIRGRVVDDEGRGVSGAEVVVFEPDPVDQDAGERSGWARKARRREEGGFLSARTGASGRYELAHVEERELTLAARAPGYEPIALLVVEPGRDPEDIVLVRLSSIAGTIVDAQTGRPISSFMVHAFSKRNTGSGDQLLPRVYEDPSGSFVVAGVPPGRWDVVVVARGYGAWTGNVTTPAGGEARIDAALERGRTLRGTVVDAVVGAPVGGVTLTVHGKVQGSHPVPGDQTVTDENGAFSFDGLTPGSFSLHPYRPGYFAEKENVRLKIGSEDPEPIRIAMRPGGTLEGRIENFQRDRVLWSALVLKRIAAEKSDGAPAAPTGHENSVRISPDIASGKFSSSSVPQGGYQVQLEDQIAKPSVDTSKLILAEDMETRLTDLGQVEVRIGETTVFNARAP